MFAACMASESNEDEYQAVNHEVTLIDKNGGYQSSFKWYLNGLSKPNELSLKGKTCWALAYCQALNAD